MKNTMLLILFMLVTMLPMTSYAIEASDALASSSSLVEYSSPLPASFTVDQLFDRMEERSVSINAISAEVELIDAVGSSTAVTLRVKSPDKFSITFSDKSNGVYFNGTKLWIYIKDLNECFYHFSEPMPWWSKVGGLMSWFEPKKIFVDMTRSTLTAIFDIEPIKREEQPDKDFYYYLKLTPKYKDICTKIFELGHYEAVFSEKLYLPVKVKEFGSEGKPNNHLVVKSYKMNEEVSNDLFEFKNETGAVMMPISVVILQKIEEYRDKAIEQFNKAKEAMTNSILNWSF